MNEYWGLVSQIGLWGWVVTVLFLIHYSFPADNRFVTKEAGKLGLISISFFALWVAGMLLA